MPRNQSIDYLKLLLSFMVVGIHAHFLQDISSFGSYILVEGYFRTAVPIFFILNGFYFYKTLQQGGARQWLSRILRLYLIWTALYAFFWFDPSDFQITHALKAVFLGYHHLWYFVGVIGAALLVLLLRPLPDRVLLGIAAVFFCFGVSVQYLGHYNLLVNTGVFSSLDNLHIYRNFLFFGFPFFAFGYIAQKHAFAEKVDTKMLCFLFVLGSLILFAEGFLNYHFSPRPLQFDMFVALVAFCPAVFLLGLKVYIPGNTKIISSVATGTYLVHIFILYFLPLGLGETMATAVTIALSVLASLLLVYLNLRWKFLL